MNRKPLYRAVALRKRHKIETSSDFWNVMRALNLVTCRFLPKTAKHDAYTLFYQNILDGFFWNPDENVILMPNKILSLVSIRVHQKTVFFLVSIYLGARSVRIGTVNEHVKYFANQWWFGRTTTRLKITIILQWRIPRERAPLT